MQHKFNLLVSSVLRGAQMLFGIIVLGLSVTLIKDQNDHGDYPGPWSSAPVALTLSAAIGALSLAAAILSLTIAWTDCLREYIEMLVDVIVVVANVVGVGVVGVVVMVVDDDIGRIGLIVACESVVIVAACSVAVTVISLSSSSSIL